MAFMNWDPSLNIGIDIIDKQHQRIVEYINKLDHVVRGKEQSHSYMDDLQSVVNELVDYTITHFAFEEEMMQKANYQFFNAHKKVHDVFTSKVASHQEKLKNGEDISKELMSELKTWLINHIKRDDRDYKEPVSKALNNRGWIKTMFTKVFG